MVKEGCNDWRGKVEVGCFLNERGYGGLVYTLSKEVGSCNYATMISPGLLPVCVVRVLFTLPCRPTLLPVVTWFQLSIEIVFAVKCLFPRT